MMNSLKWLSLLLGIAALATLASANSVKSYVLIENQTPYNLNWKYQHSYQMDSWAFPKTVSAQKTRVVPAEFNHGVLRVWDDDAAEVDYAVGESSCELRIGASHRGGQKQNKPELYAYLKDGTGCGTNSEVVHIDVEDGVVFHLVLLNKDGATELTKGHFGQLI